MAMNDATPHIERMAEQLNAIRKHLATIENTHNVVQQLTAGVEALRRQSELQTETAAEMSIVTVLAELNALEKLLDEESLQTQKLIERGERALEMQRGVFEKSIEDVGADRNRRVAKLLEPVFTIIDHDAEEHIATRYPPVLKHLEAFGATINGQIREREDTIKTRLDRVLGVVEDFAKSRQQMLDGIKSVKRAGDPESEPEALSIPFYYVATRNRKTGDTETKVLPPSSVVAAEWSLAGFDLKPAAGFERYTERLEDEVPEFGGPSSEVTADNLLPDQAAEEGSPAGAAEKILRNLLGRRSIRMSGHEFEAEEGGADV